MALIGKIRNNMWFVFVLIAFALAAFILMDAMGPGGGSGGGITGNTAIGVVAGEKIKQMDFERSFQALFSNSADPLVSRSALWNFVVEDKILQKEAESVGLNVGHDELMDLQFGQNLSPIVYQNFINPATGQLDVQRLQQIKQSIDNGGADLDASFRMFWGEQEKQVIKNQLQTKLTNMVQKAIYTPNWVAELAFKEENSLADIAYVKLPFDKLPADNITVSDKDIDAYIKKNKTEFEEKEERRTIEFVSLSILPTASDSASRFEAVTKLIENFKTAKNDSSFAFSNAGFYRHYYAKAEEIDEFYLDKLAGFQNGEVYGPYVLGSSYQAIKVIDRAIVPDSVKANHILRRFDPNTPGQDDVAEKLIDSLLLVLNTGKGIFDTLALNFSQDFTNNTNGGSLGTFGQGDMVKAFNDVCFLTGQSGKYYKVKTQFGIHIVHVEKQVFNTREQKYKVAYVNVPIIPSKETQDAGYDAMLNIVSSYSYLEELKKAVSEDPMFSMSTSQALGINDYNISGLGSGNTSRDIVKWAFNRDSRPNDVSASVYQYTDPINYFTSRYVVAALGKVLKPGLPKAADVRNQVEFAVLNELKAKAAVAKISTKDLSALAAEYKVKVDTLIGLNLYNTFVAGLGAEPKVIGAAFGQNQGDVTAPILGNSGVFVVKTLNKTEAGQANNIAFLRRTISEKNQAGIPSKLMESLKSLFKIKDNRAIFY